MEEVYFYVNYSFDSATINAPKTLNLELDCRDNPTLEDFYKFMAFNLKFPEGFGYNLDALFDAMLDLDWSKFNFINISFTRTDSFMSGEDSDKVNVFIETLNDIAIAIYSEPVFDKQDFRKINFYFEHSDRIVKLLDDNFIIYKDL